MTTDIGHSLSEQETGACQLPKTVMDILGGEQRNGELAVGSVLSIPTHARTISEDSTVSFDMNTAMTGPLFVPCALFVPHVEKLTEGSHLVGKIVLGRKLGAGVQARVYELLKESGEPLGKVVKLCHVDIPHRMINAVWLGLEREWETGMKIRAALQNPDGSLPGFLRVCDGIISPRGNGKAIFAGMVLEKLNGWEVYKRVQAPEFHNIHYIREMLRQVFTSLFKAERETGFFHADLGPRNVMEHYPQFWKSDSADNSLMPGCNLELEGGMGTEKSPLGNDSIDAVRNDDDEEVISSFASYSQNAFDTVSNDMTNRGPGSTIHPRPGFCCNKDGSLMPLGPKVEFKIIDYGASYFSETLAQATGGYRSRKNYERMKRMFLAKELAFLSARRNPGEKNRKHIVSLKTTAGADNVKDSRRYRCIPASVKRLFKKSDSREIETHNARFTTIPSGSCDSAPTTPHRMQSFSLDHIPLDPIDEQSERLRTTESMVQQVENYAETNEELEPPPEPRQGLIERLYRKFWRRKGDVYHILLNLCILLDNRVWPKEDEMDVNLFLSLVYQVTGVKMKAAFARESEPKAAGLFGRMGCFGTASQFPAYGSRGDNFCSRLRKARSQLKAHLHPYNSGISAGQALMSPFFDVEGQLSSSIASTVGPIEISNAFPSISSIILLKVFGALGAMVVVPKLC